MGTPQAGKGAYGDDRYCLCCGEGNPLGFKMAFRFEGERILSETVVPREFQGFAGIVHGGVLGVLLDELMVNFHWLKGGRSVTAEYQVRLKAPCPVGKRLFLSAWCVETRKGIHFMAAEARLEEGALVAEATAKCLAPRVSA